MVDLDLAWDQVCWWNSRLLHNQAVLIAQCDLLSKKFRRAIVSAHELQTKFAQLEREQARARQQTNLADRKALLSELGLVVGEWITVETPPTAAVTFAVQDATYLDSNRRTVVRLAGTHVSKDGKLMSRHMDATLSKDPTRPYRLIRHGHVFDCKPFDVPLLGDWSEPDFFAQFNDEEKARWNTSAARTTGLSQEYGELHHILSGVYNEYARDTFRDSTSRMTGDAKVVQAISVIFADEIDRLSEMECRALSRELMARCKLKSGQLIQIGKERVRFLSMTVVRRPYRTTLQITGQPIFSDGSPAGDAKTFDLNAYEAQNVRPVESR